MTLRVLVVPRLGIRGAVFVRGDISVQLNRPKMLWSVKRVLLIVNNVMIVRRVLRASMGLRMVQISYVKRHMELLVMNQTGNVLMI